MDEYFKSDEFWNDCRKHNFCSEDVSSRDRMGLAKALFVTAENRDWWREQYYLMKERIGTKEDAWHSFTKGPEPVSNCPTCKSGIGCIEHEKDEK